MPTEDHELGDPTSAGATKPASRRWPVAVAGFGAGVLLVGALGVVSQRVEADRSDVGVPTSAPQAATGQAQDCDPTDRGDIGASVQGQLDAFAQRDFDAALSFATSGFRANVDADRLEELILGSYPVAADAVGSELGECAVFGQDAQALVRVTDDNGREQLLVYILEFEDTVWRIAGATDPRPQDTSPTI